jgi:hypothetical protein
MTLRMLFLASVLAMPFTATANDLRLMQLEHEVRRLERQVQALTRRVEEAERPRFDAARPPVESKSPTAPGDAWLDAAKWRNVKTGMSELEVIALLGAPTSMREEAGARVLLYALEVGASGFLGGSVRVRESAVIAVETPRLR